MRGQGGGKPQALAWFGAVAGAVLVPAEGAMGRGGPPAGALVLTEGGQLMVHDLATLQPSPLTLPFQALPAATATRFLLPAALVGLLRRHAISVSITCCLP